MSQVTFWERCAWGTTWLLPPLYLKILQYFSPKAKLLHPRSPKNNFPEDIIESLSTYHILEDVRPQTSIMLWQQSAGKKDHRLEFEHIYFVIPNQMTLKNVDIMVRYPGLGVGVGSSEYYFVWLTDHAFFHDACLPLNLDIP